ncbi:MAG: hypothetical protein WCQ91_05185 [Planctomycetota bacterium]
MKPHVIRLSSAWEPPAAGADSGSLGDGKAWVRRFGQPAGVCPGDAVLLVIESPVMATLCLNGIPLPPLLRQMRWDHDIAPMLRERNVLSLVLGDGVAEESTLRDAHGRSPLPVAYGRVWIEIRDSHP